MKVAIIGSGIVGLTLAYTLTEKNIEVTIFEKEKDSLSHGTGRNSGVIHSGIYYQPNTLRSNLCIKGAKLMKKFIVDNNLYINSCGKLLLPKTKNDIETLKLDRNGDMQVFKFFKTASKVLEDAGKEDEAFYMEQMVDWLKSGKPLPTSEEQITRALGV